MSVDSIIFVTSNPHKAEEVRRIFKKYGLRFKIHSMKTLEVQSTSLAEIACISAAQAYANLEKPLFVEDSGLFIEALQGFPGPYSSYVYKTIGLDGVLKLVGDRREAVFKSVICLYGVEDRPLFFSGESRGRIAEEPRGRHGFGFDPIFIPRGSRKTLAEMSLDEKNRFSHRGRAVEGLVKWIYKDRGRSAGR
uniref:dITP/XTP pyrophosphatase n=1 Tax=Caldiarchaeum subterraneum TaxID=311458 RepID=A0A7C4I3R6_CALS0